MFSSNFIKINLKKLKSVEQAKKMLQHNDICINNISPESLFEYKGMVDFVYVDNSTYKVVAYVSKGDNEITFTNEFLDYMVSLPSIGMKNRVVNNNFDLDSILEKISAYGIDSLTQSEREYLDKKSK